MKNKVFWSPNILWRPEENGIRIDDEVYHLEDYFPQLYYITSFGCDFNDILDKFQDLPGEQTREVVGFLLKKKILINTVQDIGNLFDGQDMLFESENPYDKDMLLNPEAIEAFKQRTLIRRQPSSNDNVKKLIKYEWSGVVNARRSVREFSNDMVTWE